MISTITMHMVVLLCATSMLIDISHTLTQDAIDKGFVYLHDIDPSIIISPRYATNENFTGSIIDGYKKQTVVMTKQAAEALRTVQNIINNDGYSLVVYDGYRPQKAVNHFMRWSKDIHNQTKKASYYPRVNKADVFNLGYVAARSGHSRGSTVDLTLIKKGNTLQPITMHYRTLNDGFTIPILDDSTIDMGSSWDLFDTASHYENSLINISFQHLRTYLKNVMDQADFNNYTEEWWHFTLRNEPYPANQDSSYFDFDIE